ncbi:ANGPT4 [Bugula neritina]|uniref:ANGPT4 n=1 Tax=Bugula neritina TaxID=10212 RepID=A0A7J7KCJ4_BUGNE|nr:ANGPT4 [Bugula neritina]
MEVDGLCFKEEWMVQLISTETGYNYKLGFGDLNGEFWLGNDKLVALLQANPKNELRFDLESTTNEQAYAKYSNFNVGDESTGYTLSVSGYNGTAGIDF